MIPNYTKAGREADTYIHGLVTHISQRIRETIPDLISIILMGGFGRGEGIVQKTPTGYRPINDFDFYIITEKQHDDETIETLARRISKELGFGGLAHAEAFETKRYTFKEFFHIDIRCIPRAKLPHLPSMIRYYEIRNAGMTVYGENVLKEFPDIHGENLSLADGLRGYMNRMMLMLISIKPEWIRNPKLMTEEEILVMHYYIAKLYMTCAENLLLISKDFEPTYWGRAATLEKIYTKKFPELAQKHPDLPTLVNAYLSYKKTLIPPTQDVIAAWFHAQEITQTLFHYSLEQLTNKQAPTELKTQYEFMKNHLAYPYYEGYARFILKKYHLNNTLFRRILSRLGMVYLSYKYSQRMHYLEKTGRLHYLSYHDPGLRIIALITLIFFSIRRDGSYDTELVAYAMEELKKVYPVGPWDSWEGAKLEHLKAQRSYFLMRFV